MGPVGEIERNILVSSLFGGSEGARVDGKLGMTAKFGEMVEDKVPIVIEGNDRSHHRIKEARGFGLKAGSKKIGKGIGALLFLFNFWYL